MSFDSHASLDGDRDGEVRKSLRRIKPAKRLTRLEHRELSQLVAIGSVTRPINLLLDTTVYIDQMQQKLPLEVQIHLRAGAVWHSTVTESELSTVAGRLDPNHRDSNAAIEQVFASIEHRSPHRIVNPDRAVWREAGILGGLLGRLQQYSKTDQRRVLNDALIFLSAAKAGLTVLTRNTTDFDLLQQLLPSGKFVFYQVP